MQSWRLLSSYIRRPYTLPWVYLFLPNMLCLRIGLRMNSSKSDLLWAPRSCSPLDQCPPRTKIHDVREDKAKIELQDPAQGWWTRVLVIEIIAVGDFASKPHRRRSSLVMSLSLKPLDLLRRSLR
ncbi:hypothetical protein CLAIMM_05645 [Cladophialophora immunda]|nr:hypothetical protein CLAIMM_05645 [Cladophialophora immunda]